VGMPVRVVATGVASYGPTVKATRYDEMTGVSSNDVRVRPPPRSCWDAMGMFATAMRPLGCTSSSAKRALNSGSSKQGKARRASAASNCVAA
jgi:hypothetical protein